MFATTVDGCYRKLLNDSNKVEINPINKDMNKEYSEYTLATPAVKAIFNKDMKK